MIISLLFVTSFLTYTQAEIPWQYFKGVTKHFHGSDVHYSPLMGRLALDSGLIYNLRFYGDFQHAYKQDKKSNRTIRKYDDDKPNDSMMKLVKILFPSPAGELASVSEAETNFGRLANLTHVVSLLKLTKQVRSYFKNNASYHINPTIDLVHAYQLEQKYADINNVQRKFNIIQVVAQCVKLEYNPKNERIWTRDYSSRVGYKLTQQLQLQQQKQQQQEQKQPVNTTDGVADIKQLSQLLVDVKTRMASSQYVKLGRHKQLQQMLHKALYPQYTTEQIILAFFVHRFDNQLDIQHLVMQLQSQLIDPQQWTKDNFEEFKHNVQFKNQDNKSCCDLDFLFVKTWRQLDAPIPYKNKANPINSGNCPLIKYDENGEKVIDESIKTTLLSNMDTGPSFYSTRNTFADCAETSIRQFVNIGFYDQESQQFHVPVQIKNQNKYLKNFYSKQTRLLENDGSRQIRGEWNLVVGGIQGIGVKYGLDNTNELSTGLINFFKVVNHILGIHGDQLQHSNSSLKYSDNEDQFWYPLQCQIKRVFVWMNPKLQESNVVVELKRFETDKTNQECYGDVLITITNQYQNKFSFELHTGPYHSAIRNIQYQQDSIIAGDTSFCNTWNSDIVSLVGGNKIHLLHKLVANRALIDKYDKMDTVSKFVDAYEMSTGHGTNETDTLSSVFGPIVSHVMISCDADLDDFLGLQSFDRFYKVMDKLFDNHKDLNTLKKWSQFYYIGIIQLCMIIVSDKIYSNDPEFEFKYDDEMIAHVQQLASKYTDALSTHLDQSRQGRHWLLFGLKTLVEKTTQDIFEPIIYKMMISCHNHDHFRKLLFDEHNNFKSLIITTLEKIDLTKWKKWADLEVDAIRLIQLQIITGSDKKHSVEYRLFAKQLILRYADPQLLTTESQNYNTMIEILGMIVERMDQEFYEPIMFDLVMSCDRKMHWWYSDNEYRNLIQLILKNLDLSKWHKWKQIGYIRPYILNAIIQSGKLTFGINDHDYASNISQLHTLLANELICQCSDPRQLILQSYNHDQSTQIMTIACFLTLIENDYNYHDTATGNLEFDFFEQAEIIVMHASNFNHFGDLYRLIARLFVLVAQKSGRESYYSNSLDFAVRLIDRGEQIYALEMVLDLLRFVPNGTILGEQMDIIVTKIGQKILENAYQKKMRVQVHSGTEEEKELNMYNMFQLLIVQFSQMTNNPHYILHWAQQFTLFGTENLMKTALVLVYNLGNYFQIDKHSDIAAQVITIFNQYDDVATRSQNDRIIDNQLQWLYRMVQSQFTWIYQFAFDMGQKYSHYDGVSHQVSTSAGNLVHIVADQTRSPST